VKYRVQFIETVEVYADDENEAVALANEYRAWAGPDTEDVDVEALDQED
jgi:hypothetical protein